MILKYTLKTAITGLRTNKSRSILTVLGIVIGITAIMLIASLGKGAQNLILDQIQGMGSKTVIVLPGRQPKGASDSAQMFTDSLREKDFDSLSKKSNAPTISRIMPVVFGAETAVYGSETYRMTIFGASPMISEIFDLDVDKGEFFTDEDVKSLADVAVIGANIKDELFGSSDAIGQRVKIKNRTFRIVGTMPKKGQVSFFNFDDIAVIPYTTTQQYILGVKYYQRLIIQADSEANIKRTVRDVETTLRNNHDITDPEKDDFHIETQEDIASRLSVVTDVLTMFLIAVAAISLIVGGIGIMNIMLVSVTERTREIGLRKAVGATEKDVLFQFLLESVLLTGTGGAIGIALGAILSFLVALILSNVVGLSWEFVFPLSATLIGLFVSGMVGLVFGLYPAKQAARKSPMEALRYE
ncbi:MAG: hypothetical protein US89_C0004G0107 [Candidatus Peregrinibacteria bacterium GW2011_GWF2_38_29]|nr:MAG: hypothetical protein US89_C0004G0107 [Candidatus Peregrinibacteria bacterium GW2011_GWF2_38_29]HBB02505.1 multidrug ABC transporter substrate-binding protein [Candidatus Peregrinibacteria bacterium]